MNSYKATVGNDLFPKIDLIVNLGFDLTLSRSFNYAGIEFLEGLDRTKVCSTINRYCLENKNKVNIIVDEKNDVYIFNGVDNNHLNALLVSEGYATFV